MEYRKLGPSDIEVSRLCVGCMSFGDPASKMHDWTLNPEESERIVAHALDLGINFFDTANCYSAETSEEYLGKAIKNNVQRDKVVLATKVYFNPGHLSKEAIKREVEGSLKRLGTDYVDLLIIHRFDSGTPVEETMEALHNLVAAGRLARPWSADTLRSKTDVVAKGKYDNTQDTDIKIVEGVAAIAENYGCTMTQVALAWQFAKGVTCPIIGATKSKYLDDAEGALNLTLTPEEINYLEELYVPHKIVGAL
ncbi:aldo/keto reductase [Clostridium culturomicium]|uniref:aldo/keto reductase n=1 Tax=Clostridium culturomicium TaxID=1499683 RepID=UPI00058E9E10|nr:aldo/keto reductase [Clostridium culturomicium]